MPGALIAVAAALVGAAIASVAVSRRARRAVDLARSMAERVVANASDAVIACGPDGVTITAWNPAAERLFGWSAAEVVGRPLPTLGDPTMARERDDFLERVRRGEDVSVVTRRVRRDGVPIDVRIRYSAFASDDGSFAGWMGTVTDVTAERLLERERAERTELVERLDAIVADVNADLDLDTVLERITTNASSLLDAVGAGFAVVEDDFARIAAATGAMGDWVGYRFAPGEGTFRRAFSENRQIVVEDYSTDPDRMRVLHEIGSAVITPVRVRDEHLGALAVFFAEQRRDVSSVQLEILNLLATHAGTALVNARAYGAMARGRAAAQELLDRLVDGIAVLDERGNVIRWNRAAATLTGLRAGEVLGRQLPWRTGTRAEPAAHRLRDDTWMEAMAAPLPESGGAMVVLRDVSQQRAADEAASTHLAVVAHELGTAVTVISGYARRLHDRLPSMDQGEQRSAIDAIRRRAAELERAIDRLAIDSLADLDRVALEPSAIDLAPVVRASIALVEVVSRAHVVDVRFAVDLPHVLADADAVSRILAQLLENAVKYSPAGGTITVRAEPRDHDVVVSVSDEGVGLAAGDEERIFERFVRAPSDVAGAGLGLFIVRRLVEAQGGAAWAARHDGPGATFAFSLPRA